MSKVEELRSRYQLPPISPSVQKIARLIVERDSAPMDVIAKIVAGDAALTKRMICLAYPRLSAREGATVEMAASRLGVNWLIVLLIGDLLSHAVIDTYNIMMSLPLEVEDPTNAPKNQDDYLKASIAFKGKSSGRVTLKFSPEMNQKVTCSLMGCSESEVFAPEVKTDAVGELVNIVTGNLQSRLDDAGMTSKMDKPKVGKECDVMVIPDARNEQFYFFTGKNILFVELSINPFS